jgi:hypothetical protein
LSVPLTVGFNETIAYSMSFSATGTRGGSFNFIGQVVPSPPPSSAAMLGGGSLVQESLVPPNNFFAVVLEHPPLAAGDSFVFDGGFYTTEVVTPEPGTMGLVLIAAAGLLARRRARKRVMTAL